MVRCLPVLIPDTVEKKTYLVRAQLLLTFFDVEIIRYFQNLKVRLNLYLCKEFLLPLLSVLLGAFGLRVSFFYLIFFYSFTSFFILALFHIFAKVRCTRQDFGKLCLVSIVLAFHL